MSYSRNIPDWQQYNALQSGGSEAAKSGQNISSSHLYIPNISPSSMNGLNLSSDCLSKSQNDVINYSQRNYQPPNNTPSGPNSLVEPPLTSLVHMSSCVGHYGASSSMNSMMDDSSNMDLRNGSVASLNEEIAHRNQISLNGPVPRGVVGPNMNVANNMGTAGTRIPPTNTVPSSRQGPPYMSSCKGPCCVSDTNVNYQNWEKFPSYQSNNPYRENIRASGYANESRRYRNDIAYRKDSYTSKDLIPPNTYHLDQRRNFTDYKYCKDPPVPRNYQTSTVLPNYPIQNYSVPSEYQKYPYPMKDYQKQVAMNSQNTGILKYSEHNVTTMQEKYSPKQGQYQSGALLQKGLCVPSISSNISSVQNPYLNPQFSRDYQWENHEKDSNKIQNPVPMHSTYPKYQMYQQKYAMQRFSMENHLRELSRIPGYQSHPKYQECILRYRELLRLQQTVDYQSAFQNSLNSSNSSVPPINLQFDQNGVLINSNYLPGNFPTPHNPTNSTPNSLNPEKEHSPSEDLQQLQNLPPRSVQSTIQNQETIPRDVQFLNQKTIENPHCHVNVQREEENFETLNSRKESEKNSKNLSNKPDLDVRQFLANWVEVEEEDGANANLPDVVLSNSTPIVVVEYGNVGLVTHTSENTAEPKTDNETTTLKSQEYFSKEQTDSNLLQDSSTDLNQGIIYANKLNIKCVGEGIDGVPTIHIVENPEEEFIYTEKTTTSAEIEGPGGSLPSLTDTKECDSETKETSMNLNYKKLTQKNSDSKLQMTPEDLSILPPLATKNNSETETNLKKQNGFMNEENQNSDDISLPDLTTSECTPISTTLNTPTHSDSEECSDQGVDLTTSTNPIELIQNSPMISFTQSPVKMDPYEHLKGENISLKTSQDGLDFDFQSNNESVIKSQILEHNKDEKKMKNDTVTSKELNTTKYCQEKSMSIITENPMNKDTNKFSSNMDVFSTEEQDKWCWNSISLIPGEENDKSKISTQEENGMTKILKDPTVLNDFELNDEKINKVDDMWLDYNISKGIDLSSDIKTSNNEKLYNDPLDHKIQKKTDIAQVSASVTKILKNIKDRQHFMQNLMHEPNNIKKNPKGINIISEEIFKSTWKQNTQNKNYHPIRKMSDSFERQEIFDFDEKLKYPHRSRSKSLETNSIRSRSKSTESTIIDDQEENRLLMEFKNLKRKRSIDHFQDETKLQKLTLEPSKENSTNPTTVEVLNSKNVNDEKKLNPNEGKSSDLEIKFRNSCDSSKPFEAIKIEINVSRSDGKTENQVSSSQPQKCNETDYNGNQEEPSSCGSTICSGKNLTCQSSSKVETKIPNQKLHDNLEKMNFEKIGEKSKIQGNERKESVIEYYEKGHHHKISQHGYSACDTCKSMNFHKIDKDYLCNHLDNRSTKSHENNECLMNSLERSNSTIECLSSRLKSISKSKSLEDVKKKLKSQNVKNSRKHKFKDVGNFSGFENNRTDKMDIDDNLEILACTSDSSGFRTSQNIDLLKDDLSDKSDDAKHFVIKNSLHCDSNSFDDNHFQISDDNQENLNSNLLDSENSLSPKGYLNPLFNSLEDVENLNAVPVYTTKDGKITYSPNPRFTYRTLLMEAREKECQDESFNYSSTSQDKRSSKSSEKRAFNSKHQTDAKPPKKSLAKRFATQELEKSYQRYLSHRDKKASISNNEPMLIKTIKNYSALNDSSSGNEEIDDKLNRSSNSDFDDIHLEIEREITTNCLKEQISEEKVNVSDEISSVAESSEEHQIERINVQVFTEIQSPTPRDIEDNQVVPVAVNDKNSLTDSNNVAKNNSSTHSIVEKSVQENLNSVENTLGISEVDRIQHCSVDFNIPNSDSKSQVEIKSNPVKEIDVPDSSINAKLKFINNTSILHLFNNSFITRRRSTSDVQLQSSKLISERRKSVHIFPNLPPSINLDSTENLLTPNIQISTSDLKNSSENKIPDSMQNIENVRNDEMEIIETENNVKEDNFEINNIETDNVKSNNVETENFTTINKQSEIEKIESIVINNIESKNSETENVEINKNIEENLEIVKSNLLENTFDDNQKKIIEKDIPIIDIDENETECLITKESPTKKENKIEIIEIDDDDDVFIIEPKVEIAQCSGTLENMDKEQEIESEKKAEANSEEIQLPDNQVKEAKTQPDLKFESNIINDVEIQKIEFPSDPEKIQLLNDQVKEADIETDLKLESNIINNDEIQEVDFLSISEKEIISNIEPQSSKTHDDNQSFNQINEKYSKSFDLERLEESTNLAASENKLSDFEREVEILSEIIARQESENYPENEVHHFTNDDYLNELEEPKNEFQEDNQELRQENQENNQQNHENNKEHDENNQQYQEYQQIKEVNHENQETKQQNVDYNHQNREHQQIKEINHENQENKKQNKESNEENNLENQKLSDENYESNYKNEENLNNIPVTNKNYEKELKNCEKEYFQTRGLSPSFETNSPTETTFNNNFENLTNISEKISNEECSINENKIESNKSDFQNDDLPLITEKDNEKFDFDSVYIDDESCFEIDPPILEIQRELNDSEMINFSKSSDSNEFNKMPDVTLEEGEKQESCVKNSVVEKMVPKLVIRKIEINRSTSIAKSKSAESNVEPSFHRKIPKMIIRNAKSRPTTPTIEEIPEELPLSQEESNVIKVKIRLDDINKNNDSYIFSNEENRIPKMKINLEDKLPKVVIKNLDIRNPQDIKKLVPKVKIKKLKNLHTISDNTNEFNSIITHNSEINDSSSKLTDDSCTNSKLLEVTKTSESIVESNDNKLKIRKLKIKKDLKTNSMSRKRHNSDGTTMENNKKVKRSMRDETKQDKIMENPLSLSDCQNMSEKIPKVIIKRTSPTAEFKCEVSNDKKNTSVHDLCLQPQVVLQRSWILDCMAKELKHVNIALKLAIAKNGSKASVRGKSNTSKIRWEQFIRSLKKQKELSKSESNGNVISSKVKKRRKSDMEIRYFNSDSKNLYNIKACKSARESTISDTNYLNNRALYFKNMFSANIIKNNQQYNSFETWKKFDENMNSESKDLLQNSDKFDFSPFPNNIVEQDNNQREIKLNEDGEIKCPLLNAEEVDNKANLSLDIGSSPMNIDEIQMMTGIKIEENPTIFDCPEFSNSIMANGEHEHLYSEDAIPTQFEFELEIVDSSVDTYDVPMSDSKEFLESIDSVDLENSNNILEKESTNNYDQLPRLLLPDEDTSCGNNNGRDDSCDIKDEIPILNDLMNLSDVTSENLEQPSGSCSNSKFSDSLSLVQEVMAAKEILKKYLPNCRTESTSIKSRPKTLAEKKQGTGFSLVEPGDNNLTSTRTSEHRSSRNHTKYDKKRSKESSSSREKYKTALKLEEDTCNYDHHNTISLRDQKRSSLHHLNKTQESSKNKDSDSRSKSSDLCSKRSRSKSNSQSQKSRESSRDSWKGPRESSKDTRDGDVNKMKSYKIPKISKSKENNGDNATEVKAKEEMPILEPEGEVNVDPSLARDTSRSPPVITNQNDVEILESESKIFNVDVKKEDNVSWNMKTSQVDLGGTLADAVQNWVFHEKATIKHRRYCVLCERWFPSVIRHRRHLSGYQHRHTELTQRRTIHTLFMLFTGKPCPRLLPADVLRSDCSLGEATPLQIAVQNVALGYGNAHEKAENKDKESKK
ncbi:uncharacterized protein PF3D7_1120600-like [Leptopilina boulardi]|uniref:uncharacterized protein PF3D7_1120600-like n=1 Tax=Leptopilina boulardi TaxID=63433 RepID=UPI0021F5F25A|nr:uncharacterized protein PF3D7_1120600-like [Leptopilina boulardi]